MLQERWVRVGSAAIVVTGPRRDGARGATVRPDHPCVGRTSGVQGPFIREGTMKVVNLLAVAGLAGTLAAASAANAQVAGGVHLAAVERPAGAAPVLDDRAL